MGPSPTQSQRCDSRRDGNSICLVTFFSTVQVCAAAGTRAPETRLGRLRECAVRRPGVHPCRPRLTLPGPEGPQKGSGLHEPLGSSGEDTGRVPPDGSPHETVSVVDGHTPPCLWGRRGPDGVPESRGPRTARQGTLGRPKRPGTPVVPEPIRCTRGTLGVRGVDTTHLLSWTPPVHCPGSGPPPMAVLSLLGGLFRRPQPDSLPTPGPTTRGHSGSLPGMGGAPDTGRSHRVPRPRKRVPWVHPSRRPWRYRGKTPLWGLGPSQGRGWSRGVLRPPRSSRGPVVRRGSHCVTLGPSIPDTGTGIGETSV